MATNILYPASLAGIPIDCQTTEDGFENAIAKQETPYVNGAATEAMGAKAGTCSLRCFFSGETYENHARLLEALKSLELLELVHPVYGLKKVRAERVVVRHDDNEGTAEVDISLVEDGSAAAQVKPWQDVKGEAEKAYEESVAEQKRSVLERIAALGAKGAALCETAITRLGSLLVDVTNPANTLTGLIDYGTDLPGRFVQSAAQAAERYAIAYQTLRASPTAFMNSLAAGLLEMSNALDQFKTQGDAAGAARLAVEAAVFYAEDDQKRRSSPELKTGFDIEGRRVSSAPVETLNSAEIEAILAIADTAAQAALQGDRSQTAVKTLAAALYTAAAGLKRSAENVKRVYVNEPTPLHALCLRYKLAYSAAPRILALNPQIKDPNRVSGEILMYV
ncbi:MAG: DNA circularization N-terminal domain-containing protein [Elusimicrobiales bacterium]